jgi:hypothetical protein
MQKTICKICGKKKLNFPVFDSQTHLFKPVCRECIKLARYLIKGLDKDHPLNKKFN